MNVTLTTQQLKKAHGLTRDDLNRLFELIRSKGVIEASDKDKEAYGTLRGLNLVACKAGKIWAKFDVNGIKPRPFVGNAANPNRESKLGKNDVKTFASIFAKAYYKTARKSYGDFEGIEWAFISRLIKEFTTEEFRLLVQLYFRDTKPCKATMKDLYAKRQALFRRFEEATGGKVEECDDKEDTSSDDGW